MGRHTSAVLDGPAPDPAPPAHHMTTGDKIRFVLRGIGQTLITCGLIVLLFVFYEVYVTNWFAEAAQSKVKTELVHEFQQGKDPVAQLPDGSYPKPPAGTGIANLYIPRLGRDYAYTIVQGTSQADLAKGPGHYAGTALPGQQGNFAIAGHRVGNGEPFLNLDHLRAGDAVIVETESKFFVYQILGDQTTNNLSDRSFPGIKGVTGIPGREIIDPSDSEVLRGVPDNPSNMALLDTPLMTMTTCHPKFTAQQRMVFHAKLVRTDNKPAGDTPLDHFPDLTALYDGIS